MILLSLKNSWVIPLSIKQNEPFDCTRYLGQKKIRLYAMVA